MKLIRYLTDKSWKEKLHEEFKKEYFIKLEIFLNKEINKYNIFPEPKLIFNAFNLCPFNKIKVVILGLDPYINKDEANGLAFSVSTNTNDCHSGSSNKKIPTSLRNIYIELYNDLKIDNDKYCNLSNWGKQGVLLLNTILTVREGISHSHKDKGWEIFTDRTIELINECRNNIVFILWGNVAQVKEKLINNKKHLIIKASHPRPISANKTTYPFIGSKCFSKTNKYLKKNNLKEINWKV